MSMDRIREILDTTEAKDLQWKDTSEKDFPKLSFCAGKFVFEIWSLNTGEERVIGAGAFLNDAYHREFLEYPEGDERQDLVKSGYIGECDQSEGMEALRMAWEMRLEKVDPISDAESFFPNFPTKIAESACGFMDELGWPAHTTKGLSIILDEPFTVFFGGKGKMVKQIDFSKGFPDWKIEARE